MPSLHISDCLRFEKKNLKKTEREMFCCNFVALITAVNGCTHSCISEGGLKGSVKVGENIKTLSYGFGFL